MNSPNPYSSKNPSVFDVFRHITGGRLIFSVVSLAIVISLSAVSLLLMVGYDQGDFAGVSRLHQSRDITVPLAYAPPRADESMIKLRPGTDPGLFPAIDFPPEAELVDTDRTHGFYTYLTRDELVDFIAKYGEFDDNWAVCRLVVLKDATWVRIALSMDAAKGMLSALDQDGNTRYVYYVDLPTQLFGASPVSGFLCRLLIHVSELTHLKVAESIIFIALASVVLIIILFEIWERFVYREAKFDAVGEYIMMSDNSFPDDDLDGFN